MYRQKSLRFLAPFRTYRLKLQVAFGGLALLAIAVTVWEAGLGASAALQDATLERLTVIRQTRCRMIERYFDDAANHVLALSTDEAAIAALERFRESWRSVAAPPGAAEALKPFYKALQFPQPSDPLAVPLQYHYIAANPYPVGSKDRLLSAPGAGAYGVAHSRYHPTLHRYQSAFGFYDIFLIDPSGRVLYSVFKEVDLGEDLAAAPYRDTALARAFRRAMALEETERAVLEDFAAYVPSADAPAAFLAAPVWRQGEKYGVLAIQVSIDEVDRVMSGGDWQAAGLGRSGQAYMVDSANLLRSNLRSTRDTTDVLHPSPGRPVSGTGTAPSADGRLFRSWAPLRVRDVQWSLIAEIDAAEALAPATQVQLRIGGYGLLVALAFILVASWLGRGVTRPVLQLASRARLLGQGDFRARIAVDRNDELGELATSFNRMAENLEQTTVSKHAVDHILDSMLNAVIVAENGLITRANPAAEQLLGYGPGELTGTPAPPVSALLGRPAVETELIRKDGQTVPVFLAAARMKGSDAIVCAAQDISEIRRLSGRLIAAQEDERRRIARELHDDFSQRLAAAAIAAGQGQMEAVRQQLASIADDVHALSRRLHPAILEDLGLHAALSAYARSSFERGGPPVNLEMEGPTDALGPDIALAIYRIVQEALRNAARHAEAQEVTVRLVTGPGVVSLDISDDGQGFDRNQPGFRPGLGLASMEERVRLLGGSWSLHARPGLGTHISVRLPRVAPS